VNAAGEPNYGQQGTTNYLVIRHRQQLLFVKSARFSFIDSQDATRDRAYPIYGNLKACKNCCSTKGHAIFAAVPEFATREHVWAAWAAHFVSALQHGEKYTRY